MTVTLRSALLVAMVMAGSAGCRKKSAPVPAGHGPPMPAAELKRGEEACAAYVKEACACAETVPALVEDCALAKSLPAAITAAVQFGQSDNATRADTAQAADMVRKTTANCISSTAALPSRGCAVTR